MLERIAIESGIQRTMEYLWAYELSVYMAQAEAVWQALEGASYLQLSHETKVKIARLAMEAKRMTAKAIQEELTRLIEADMAAQMEHYNKAYKAGVITSAPKIPPVVVAANADAIVSIGDFILKTIDRIASYAGQEVADIMDEAIEAKLKGETAHKVAQSASSAIRARGVQLTYPSGRKIHDVYAYVRQNIMTAVVYNSGDQQRILYEHMDMPEDNRGFITSSHWGARPSHALWQGRIFKTWAELERVTEYRTITGLEGINCRHTWYPFIIGVDTQTYFPKDKTENDRRYEARQKSNRMKSEIRKLVIEDEVLKALGQPEKNKARIKLLRSRSRKIDQEEKRLAREWFEREKALAHAGQ